MAIVGKFIKGGFDMGGGILNVRCWISFSLFLIIIFFMNAPVFAVKGTITVTDKEIIERLTRLEEGLKRLEEGLVRLEERQRGLEQSLNKRIDDLRNLIYVVLAGIFALVGFVIWDRRSAISPVIKQTRDIEEEERKILKVLREYSRKEPKFAEVMKSVGLL